MILYNEQEVENGKKIMENEKNKDKYNGDNYTYIEDIWLKEIHNNFFIKRIFIEFDNNHCYEFKHEISFILDNFRVYTNIECFWGYTFYVYTNTHLYYANGLKNKYNKYFNVIKLL